MQQYKLNSKNKIKFIEWKIKENSKIAQGSVIFVYENIDNGKSDRFKSHLGGITVDKLREIKKEDILEPGDLLFTYENCLHHITHHDLCAECGQDLKRDTSTVQQSSNNASVPIIHTRPHLKVTDKFAKTVGVEHLKSLIKNRKLVLLVDLDHTIIHTTCEPVDKDLEGVHHYELIHRGVWYHTKFRPGLTQFLEKMSKLFELHIVSFGERTYAHKIADLMDPERRYFHDRILSRNEIFNQQSKTDNLKSLFPCGDLLVCIIDDRDDVWNYARNLIGVQPYVYFKNTGDINDPSLFNKPQQPSTNDQSESTAAANPLPAPPPPPPPTSTLTTTTTSPTTSSSSSSSSSTTTEASTPEQSKTDDPDDYLKYLENILVKIHDEYYKKYDETIEQNQLNEETINYETTLPDMKKIAPEIKCQVLKDVVITFSGVIPTGYDLPKQHCYHMATSLGARVNRQLVLPDNKDKCDEPLTTHLVAANYSTRKVHEASKGQIEIVKPEWLIMCHYKWLRCPESEFKLTNEYDYKNCLFHQEYNYNQQRSYPGSGNSSGPSKRHPVDNNLLGSGSELKSKKQKSMQEPSGFASNELTNTDESSGSEKVSEKEGEELNNEDKKLFHFTSNELDNMDKEIQEELSEESNDESGEEKREDYENNSEKEEDEEEEEENLSDSSPSNNNDDKISDTNEESSKRSSKSDDSNDLSKSSNSESNDDDDGEDEDDDDNESLSSIDDEMIEELEKRY